MFKRVISLLFLPLCSRGKSPWQPMERRDCVRSGASQVVRAHELVEVRSRLYSLLLNHFTEYLGQQRGSCYRLSVSPPFIKITSLWGVSPCSLVGIPGIYHRISRICCLQFQISYAEGRGNKMSEMYVTFNQTTQCHIT